MLSESHKRYFQISLSSKGMILSVYMLEKINTRLLSLGHPQQSWDGSGWGSDGPILVVYGNDAWLDLEKAVNLELPPGGPRNKKQQSLKVVMPSLSQLRKKKNKKHTEEFHICGNRPAVMLYSFLHSNTRYNSLL